MQPDHWHRAVLFALVIHVVEAIILICFLWRICPCGCRVFYPEPDGWNFPIYPFVWHKFDAGRQPPDGWMRFLLLPVATDFPGVQVYPLTTSLRKKINPTGLCKSC